MTIIQHADVCINVIRSVAIIWNGNYVKFGLKSMDTGQIGEVQEVLLLNLIKSQKNGQHSPMELWIS